MNHPANHSITSQPLTRSDAKTLALSSLGGALEFYDFVIYIFYAHIISELFFPNTLSPFWAMLNTYGIFAAGYFFRPLGGIIMAHFGDIVGRKRLFTLSILLMSVPTLLIGLLPTFETMGYIAPLLLLLMRIIQGIAIGGEIPAAWVFVSEHSAPKRIGLSNGILTAGLSLGILLGSFISLILSTICTNEEIHQWAWRIPFIMGGAFGIFSMYLRRHLKETPVFQAMQERKQITQTLPIKLAFQQYKVSIALSMVLTWLLTACVIVIILYMPQLLVSNFGISRAQAFEWQNLAIMIQMLGCISFGFLSDRVGPGKMMMIGTLLIAIAALLFYPSLIKPEDTSLLPLYLLLSFTAGSASIIPFIMVNLFPAPIRFTGISLSYNTAYAIAGGLTLPLVHWLNQFSLIGAMFYIIFVSFLGFCAASVYYWQQRTTSHLSKPR